MSFARNAASTAAVNVCLGVLGAASGVIAARSLGPEARGQLAGGQAIGGLVATLGALGLAEAVVSKAAGSRTNAASVLGMGLILGTISSGMALAIVWPLLGTSSLDPVTREAARWYSAMGIVFVWGGFPGAALRAIGQFGWWNVLRAIGPVAWLLSLGIGAMSGESSAVATVQRFLVFQLMTVPLGLYVAWRSLPGPYRINPKLARPMLGFSVPLAIATLPTAFNLRLDQMVLAALGRTEELGLYAAAVAWSLLGAPVLVALGSVLFPRIAAISDQLERDRVIALGLRVTVLLAGFIGLVCSALSPIAIPLLFGRAFSGAVQAAFLLGIAGAIFGVALVCEEVLRGLGRSTSVLVSELVGLAVTLGALLTLIRPFGLTGAALGSVAGYGATLSVAVWRIHQETNVSLGDLLLPRRSDLADLRWRFLKAGHAKVG